MVRSSDESGRRSNLGGGRGLPHPDLSGRGNDTGGYYPVLQVYIVSPAILTRSEVLLALSVGKLSYKYRNTEGVSYSLDVLMFTGEGCS